MRHWIIILLFLTDYELKNNFKYFKDINAYCTFTSPYKLDKINIQIYLPNGELFNFGYNNNLSYHTINFLRLKLLTIDKLNKIIFICIYIFNNLI